MAHRLATIETAGRLRTIRVESFDGTHGTGTVLATGILGVFFRTSPSRPPRAPGRALSSRPVSWLR